MQDTAELFSIFTAFLTFDSKTTQLSPYQITTSLKPYFMSIIKIMSDISCQSSYSLCTCITTL